MTYWLGWLFLKCIGWSVGKGPPDLKKFIIIGYPHTSNWDLPIMLAYSFVYRIKVHWMGKKSLFRWPFGGFMRWIGGIPIDRSAHHNVVDQMVDVFHQSDSLIVCIPVEGTRKRVEYWKSGFYYIGLKGKIPIALAYLDYGRKQGGFGPTIEVTGDVEADMKQFAAFYEGIKALYPECASPVRLRPREEGTGQTELSRAVGKKESA